jgi:hypothetical protein
MRLSIQPNMFRSTSQPNGIRMREGTKSRPRVVCLHMPLVRLRALRSPTRTSYHGRDRGPSTTPGETMETTDSPRTSCVAGAAACLCSTPCLSAHESRWLVSLWRLRAPSECRTAGDRCNRVHHMVKGRALQPGWTPMGDAAGWMLRFVELLLSTDML